MIQSPRVLLCGPSRLAVSGVSTHLNQLFQSSIARKYAILQFQVGSEGRNEARLQKVFRMLTSPVVLMVTIIRHKIDIVHLNTSMDAKAYWRDLIYLSVSKLLGRNVIYQIHGGELPERFLGPNRTAQSFLRWTLSIPDAIVVLAEFERDAYLKFCTSQRVEKIPNAIDLDEYRGMVERDFEQRVVKLGYIGRLGKDKGIKETIEAVGALHRRGVEPICLRIAGSGPYEDELRDLIRSESLEESVEIVGPVFGKDKIAFWRETDVLVFPSYREGLPYVVLEALASGTPIISTRVGAITEVVQDGVQGLLVNTHDSRAVAAAIESLLCDRERLRSMSRAAIEHARKHYALERLADQFDCLYQELLA